MAAYTEIEEYIIKFYVCSLRNDFSSFDWDAMDEHFLPALQRKLDEHGLGTYEAFVEIQEDCIYGEPLPYWCTAQSDYFSFTEEDAKEAIFTAMYEKAGKAFNHLFDNIEVLVEELQSPPGTLRQRIILFDEVIHAQHVTGDIFEGLDTEDLKDAAQDIYDCMQAA